MACVTREIIKGDDLIHISGIRLGSHSWATGSSWDILYLFVDSQGHIHCSISSARWIIVHIHGIRCAGIDIGNIISRTRQSAHTITNDNRSRRVAREVHISPTLPSRTVIEAILIDLRSSRSGNRQSDSSTGWRSRRLSKAKAECTWRYEPIIMDETPIRLIIGEGCAVRVWMDGAIDDERSASIEGERRGIEGIAEVVDLAGLTTGEHWSFEAGWKIGQSSALIEGLEEVGSHCGDLAHVEASRWKTGKGSPFVKPCEETVSNRSTHGTGVEASCWKVRQRAERVEDLEETPFRGGNVVRVETSAWKAGEGSSKGVEVGEEVSSYCSTDGTGIETSGWQTHQGALRVEVLEKGISRCGDITRIEASRWETRQGTVRVEAREEVMSYRTDIAGIEASRRQTGQWSESVESSEKVISYCSDVGSIEASAWESRKQSISVEVHEEVCSYRATDVADVEASGRETREGTVTVEVRKETIAHTRRALSKPGHLWHIAYIHIARIRSGFWNKRVPITILEHPPPRSTRQRQRNHIRPRLGIGLGHPRRVLHRSTSITPINHMRICKILIDPHGLPRHRNLHRQLNLRS